MGKVKKKDFAYAMGLRGMGDEARKNKGLNSYQTSPQSQLQTRDLRVSLTNHRPSLFHLSFLHFYHRLNRVQFHISFSVCGCSS